MGQHRGIIYRPTIRRICFAFLMAAFFTANLICGSASAATAYDVITDSNGIRWEYELVTDSGEPSLSIMFYDKPENLATVTVPSLSELNDLVPGASSVQTTYFLKSADTAQQDSRYPSLTRRTPAVDTTKLDMQNTSKIQILGVKPIIDPAVETELVFGPNIVIGDIPGGIMSAYVCKEMVFDDYSQSYYCNSHKTMVANIPNSDNMTQAQIEAYVPTVADFGCWPEENVTSLNYDPNRCYIPSWGMYTYDKDSIYNYNVDITASDHTKLDVKGVFGGYKLKLTNFVESNFNYIGWAAFAGSTLHDTTVTVSGDAFAGGYIFSNTNVTKAIIETETIGTSIFRDCAMLSEVEFSSNVTKITDGAFAGSGLTSINFALTPIKTIGPRAFYGTGLTSVNLEGIERIEYSAFVDNNFTELYFPKSINYLQSNIFYGNTNLRKVTVAYDTLTSGTTLPFFVVLDGDTRGYYGNDGTASAAIEELIVLAPYGAEESVSGTHISYDNYRWHYDPYTQEYAEVVNYPDGGNKYGTVDQTYYNRKYYGTEKATYIYEFEDDYADVENKKNIVAPAYFQGLNNLKKITVGEGFEFIGSKAFLAGSNYQDDGKTWENMASFTAAGRTCYQGYYGEYCDVVKSRRIEEINLPESLKGVGNLAFEGAWSPNLKINLPENLEFIGIAAFRRVYHMNIDFDLRNVKYIGDYAFESTMLKNITLHDKIYYLGEHAFSNIPTIEDITIDFDIFDPDLMIIWINPDYFYDYGMMTTDWQTGRLDEEAAKANHTHLFKRLFGEWYAWAWDYQSQESVDRWGIKRDHRELSDSNSYHQRFGKITFTEKAVHEIPVKENVSCNYGDDCHTYDSFFGLVIADEIDLSATPWKVLPRFAMNEAKIDSIKLPENLEVIGHHAFSSTETQEEIVIPDTVKVIGTGAFESWKLAHYEYTIRNAAQNGYNLKTATIKNLPSSLEYVGYEAFWGDTNLTADLNASNLKYIGPRAFMETGIRDVYIPSGVTSLHEGTFANNANLRNIEIDADFGALVTAPYNDKLYALPQSVIDWAGSEERAYYEVSSHILERNYEDPQLKDIVTGKNFETFYTIFNKTMKESQTYLNEGQMTSGESYGILKFGSNSVMDIPGNPGTFAGLTFEKVDLGEAKWTKLTNNSDSFHSAKIGTLILPQTLQNLNRAAFMQAEITDSVTIPSSLTAISDAAFQWSKVGGINLNEGLESINGSAFYQSEVGGTVALPRSFRAINGNSFQESKLGGLSIAEGLETIGGAAFYMAEVGGQFEFPRTLKTIGSSAFMRSDIHVVNSFKEGLLSMGQAAFYDTDFTDDLVIPSTVTSIGWSAISTGDTDVHYNTVTIKPNLTVANSSSQRVHQLLWNVSVDKLIIDSSSLTAMDQGVEGPVSDYDNGEEFWNMDMKEVVINNLPKITYSAFNMCNNLETVDMSNNINIREIDDKAFMNDEKLKTVKFSPNISSEDIILGINAFTNTGLTSIGNADSDFNLYAAKFDASAGEVFSKMKALKSVDVPSTFSNAIIPEKTFYDSPELETASVAYKVKRIDNAAFANDNKLKRIFIWGNTVVLDENLPGYEAPISGMGADGDDEETLGPTIPEGTDIYAYTTSPAKDYAAYNGRDDFDGEYYPLDEVLYITSNDPTVELYENPDDFDKSNVVVYALRRDGIVLQSDNWGEFDGVSYPRSENNLHFEDMLPTIAADPDFGTIWDTPVPMSELRYDNENFAEIDYEFIRDQATDGVRLINVIYTDAFTNNKPDTDIDPYSDPSNPITLADNMAVYTIVFISLTAAVIAITAKRNLFARR